jgi:hypothetical protein
MSNEPRPIMSSRCECGGCRRKAAVNAVRMIPRQSTYADSTRRGVGQPNYDCWRMTAMVSEPARCPLCGEPDNFRTLLTERVLPYCGACGVDKTFWPRIAELVAIRDAAVAWLHSKPDSTRRMVETGAKVLRLARQEAERNERPRQPSEAPTE